MNEAAAERPSTSPPERRARIVSAATYGTVIALGALALATPQNVRTGYGIELVLGVGVATWVAHGFAEIVGELLRQREPLRGRDIGRAAAIGSPILLAVLLPAAALIPGRLEMVAGQTALWLAVAVGVLELVAIGAYIASAHGAGAVQTWRLGLAVAGIGVVVVVVKILLGSH